MNAQRTLRRPISCVGIGLHSGNKVTLSLKPAPSGFGIRFRRADLGGLEVPASVGHVGGINHATGLTRDAVNVETVEHLLAALVSLGVDNVIVELNSPEVPIMDGSAAPFVYLIHEAGIKRLPAARQYLKVLRPLSLTRGDKRIALYPSDHFKVTYSISYDHPLIGRQTIAVDVKPDVFRREIARARTFGFMRDVTSLWNSGYALGASLENTLVVSDNRILNPEGTRFPDEFVRHKALDAIGDLALAGGPLLGTYRSVRGGHKLNHAVLCALMSDTSAWAWVDGEALRPARGHAEMPARLAPAFGPDLS